MKAVLSRSVSWSNRISLETEAETAIFAKMLGGSRVAAKIML